MTTATRDVEEPHRRQTRWIRAILAGLLAEIATIVLIVLAVTIYSRLVAPGQPPAAYEAFGNRAGFVLGPLGGAALTFLFALWTARAVRSGFVAHGLVVAASAAALHLASAMAALGGIRPIFLAADALKLLAGALAGYVARRRYERWGLTPVGERGS